MSENGEIYTADKKLTLPLAVTGGTNLTSDYIYDIHDVPKNWLVEKKILTKLECCWVYDGDDDGDDDGVDM